MAQTRGRALPQEQLEATEAAAAAVYAEKQEREVEKQRRLQEQIDAEAEAQRAEEERWRRDEAARLHDGEKVKCEVTWPSALGAAAMRKLSTCEERLLMRRLVQEVATTDPSPRLDLLHELLDQLAEERRREGKKMREVLRLRRKEETRTMALVHSLWEEVADEVIREMMVGEGGVAQALDELAEDAEDATRWQEEELVAEELMQRRREEEAAADAQEEEAEEAGNIAKEEEEAHRRDADKTEAERAEREAAEGLAAKEQERQGRREARERGRDQMNKAHGQRRQDLQQLRDAASRERVARQEAREKDRDARQNERKRRRDEMRARQDAKKAFREEERVVAEEEEAMRREQIAMVREKKRLEHARRIRDQKVSKLEAEEKNMREQQDPLGLGMSKKTKRSSQEQAAFDRELKTTMDASMLIWDAQRAKEEAEEEEKRRADAERAEKDDRKRYRQVLFLIFSRYTCSSLWNADGVIEPGDWRLLSSMDKVCM